MAAARRCQFGIADRDGVLDVHGQVVHRLVVLYLAVGQTPQLVIALVTGIYKAREAIRAQPTIIVCFNPGHPRASTY